MTKTMAKRFLHTWFAIIALLRVGETFLMQLHRSRPEPRLSTFERCWLGGATGRVRSPWRSSQATRATYSRSAPPDQSARSARPARPLKRTALLAKPMNGINAPQRPDCVAGHVRFELRDVVANYPFEKSRRFAAIQPNFGHGDHSRLSCSAGDTQLGARFCRDLQQAFCTDVGHHAASPRRHELAAISFDQKMIRRRQSRQHHCAVCAGLSAQTERVW